MKWRYEFICFSFFVVVLSNHVFAQGILQGYVLDSLSKDPLPGANVLFVGTSLGASTDLDGHFRVTAIPEGQYKVQVSYIGYGSKTIDVTVKGKEMTIESFLLPPQEVRGKEVIVVSQAKGQLAAINQQVRAATIMNVVSEEKIQELPDANAAEAIGRLPGVSIIRNGGEASKVVLRGLSSKFSNITVDGVTIPGTDSTSRDVDLSMISQGSLAGIELYKALLPDQDGDAIAGTINLVTRKAPSERLIRFDLKGDYNRLMNSAGQYDFSGRYGERFFNGILGVQLQANAEQKIRSKENTSTGYQYVPNPDLPPNPSGYTWNDYKMGQFTVAFTDETRKRQGGQAIFDVNTPDSGSVKLSGFYNGTIRNILVHSRVYPGGQPGVVWDYDYRYTQTNMSTSNVSLQGKNFLSGFEVDWLGSYADSRIKNPFDYEMKFTEVPGVISGESVPSGRDHPELNIIPYAANLYNDAACSSAVYYQEQNFERQRSAALNISRKYSVGSLISGDLKMGGKYRDRSRWMDQSELDNNTYLYQFNSYNKTVTGDSINLMGTRFQDYRENRAGGPPDLSDFIDQPVPSRNLLNLYRMTPLISVDAMKLWYQLNKNGLSTAGLEYVPSAGASLNDYSINEGVSAGYIMNTFDFGYLATLMMGVRVENENDNYGARFATGGLQTIGIVVTPSPGTEIKDSTTKYAETIWLPNAQLILRPTDFFSIRFAAYRALARPDYNLRLPQFIINNNSQGTPVIMGNPNLKDPKAWNFEINPQIYSSTIGLISVSAFFKRIDDLYHQMDAVGISTGYDSVLNAIGVTWQNTNYFKQLGSKSSFLFTVPYNATQPTYVWGLEFEHQMNFLFLPGFLANTSLSYNFSITHSQTYIITRELVPDSVAHVVRGDTTWGPGPGHNIAVNAKRNSENQPVFYGNAALGYDIGGFSARVSVFFQSQYVQSYSADGTQDIRVNGFVKLDLALRQQLTKAFSLFFNVDNLTNTQETTSQVNTVNNWFLNSTRELYGTSAELGLRITL
ncbi:MAG TPA: TonB-dependent receptor [Candidatus Acidoferrales bacterium]|nr:TonB-dependent receptor [Candidatus Acidoferrales bacterium]